MKSIFTSTILLIALSCIISCANSPAIQTATTIQLQDVAQIKLGESSRSFLIEKFGNPSKEHKIDPEHYVVIYKNSATGSQNASFVLSTKTDRIITSQWIPDHSENLLDLKSIQSKLKSDNFTIKKHEITTEHESPLSYQLVDSALGITIEVSKKDHIPTSIGFSIPVIQTVGATQSR